MRTYDPNLYPERVTLCADGQYRWLYRFSREQKLLHYRKMVKICSIVGVSISVAVTALLYLTASGSNDPFWIIGVFLLIGIVGLPALAGFLGTLGDQVNRYEMDEQNIRHKNVQKGGGDAWIPLDKIRDMTVDGDAFLLKTGMTTYRVYVPTEDVPFVQRFIAEHN